MFTFVTHFTNENSSKSKYNKTVQKCVMKFARAAKRGATPPRRNIREMNMETEASKRTHCGGAVGNKAWCEENKLTPLFAFLSSKEARKELRETKQPRI